MCGYCLKCDLHIILVCTKLFKTMYKLNRKVYRHQQFYIVPCNKTYTYSNVFTKAERISDTNGPSRLDTVFRNLTNSKTADLERTDIKQAAIFQSSVSFDSPNENRKAQTKLNKSTRTSNIRFIRQFLRSFKNCLKCVHVSVSEIYLSGSEITKTCVCVHEDRICFFNFCNQTSLHLFLKKSSTEYFLHCK